ncbi:MAG: 2-iminobutanoate/2-iminopropanoate deaminase [Planctomycetota bacterium]|jgi:2-iminobutanoate/2-iminopropanoate deaminase
MASMSTRLLVWLPVLLLLGCATSRQDFGSDNPALPFNKAVLTGDTLYVSGHLGLDPATGKPPVDAAVEARRMLDAFAATMARADMTMDELVQVQVYCSDLSLYGTFNDVYRQCFHSTFPTRAFIGSAPLLMGCRFEIIGTAVRR